MSITTVDTNVDGKDALIMALFPDKPVSGDTSSPLMSLRKNSSVLYVTVRRRSVARISYKLTCDITTLGTASQKHALVILDSVIALHRFSGSPVSTLIAMTSIDWFAASGKYYNSTCD